MAAQDNGSSATTTAGRPAFAPARVRRSRSSAAALRAAAQADEIPIEGKWRPAWTLILIIGASGGLWGMVALVRFALLH